MALTKGTVHSVHTVKSAHSDTLQVAEVLFFHDPTTAYAQAEHGQIDGVAALITASRRNGKTCTMRGVMPGQTATVASSGAVLTLKTVAISTNDVTYIVCTSDWTTEAANATPLGAQGRPFSIFVAFTEA